MRIPRLIVAAIALVALARPALATDRYYRDSSAVSANGAYRIDARSPDNAGPRARPFAANFTYTLTDTATGKIIWERKQPMTRSKGNAHASWDEPSPVEEFVHDTGLVVARSAWDSLIILDGAKGKKRGEADVLRAFPQDEHDKFVSETTAGPMWSQESDWFFLTLPATAEQPPRIYFVVRPYWDHRLVIDTSTGKHVDLGGYYKATAPDDLTGAAEHVRIILTATIEEESRRAMGVLAGASDKMTSRKDDAVDWDVQVALNTVRFLKLTQAEPLVRELVRIKAAKARETLRALGKAPDDGRLPIETRTANARNIAVGMPFARVTELIGPRDAELYDGERCFDYDIDDPEPYTLRVFLDRTEQTVTKVETLKPFAFLHDPARMRGY